MTLSPGHGASLATTAGITAVITGVIAAGLLAQAPPAGDPAGALAAGAAACLFAAAGGLYAARNAIGAALDAGGDAALARRGLRLYHLGMAGLFAGLALAAAWKLALPHGMWGWAVVGLAAGVAARSTTLAFAQASPAAGTLPAPRGRDGVGASAQAREDLSSIGPALVPPPPPSPAERGGCPVTEVDRHVASMQEAP